MRMACVLVLVASCANAHVNRATLAVSTAALICDGMGTLRMAGDGWSTGHWDSNPVMGKTPSVSTVAIYFSVVAIANATLWAVAPPRLKSVVPSGIIAVQAVAITGNAEVGAGLCGM